MQPSRFVDAIGLFWLLGIAGFWVAVVHPKLNRFGTLVRRLDRYTHPNERDLIDHIQGFDVVRQYRLVIGCDKPQIRPALGKVEKVRKIAAMKPQQHRRLHDCIRLVELHHQLLSVGPGIVPPGQRGRRRQQSDNADPQGTYQVVHIATSS